MNDALSAWISRTSISIPRPSTKKEFISEQWRSKADEGLADLPENSWPKYNSLTSQTSLGSTGKSAFANAQQTTPDSAPEPIDKDNDGSELSDPQADPHLQVQGGFQYLPNCANASPSQDKTVSLTGKEANHVIDTLTATIHMVGQVAE